MARKWFAGSTVSEINVTPMADVMLVLLIIFMVITPMLQKGVSVDLAQTQNPRQMPDADKEDAVVLAVTRDGKIFLGSTPVLVGDITAKVKDRISSKLDKTVYVKSDADPAVLEQLHQQTVAFSPVGLTLSRPVRVDTDLILEQTTGGL